MGARGRMEMRRFELLDRTWGGVSSVCSVRGSAALLALAWVGLACSTTPGPSADGTGGAAPSTGGVAPVGTGAAAGSGGGPAAAGGQIGSGGGGASGGAPSASGGVGPTGGTGNGDTVTRSTSTYSFQHYPIEVDAAGVWNGSATPASTAVTTTFDTVVLENGFLKVTLLPEYGGRILSIVHKPTGTELLYQNPIGAPYLMNEDIFYYDYLVILGGIFPSFPEPEHGRYWNQPYEFAVTAESAEAITVRMSRTDDLDVTAGVPSQYDVGRTGLVVDLDVTLRAGQSSLELSTTLTNPTATATPPLEYWTVTTLAPGSVPAQTKIPANTRILADMDRVHLLESSWSWFGSAEERVDGEVFEWKNLASFENWVDQGTAFASPQYDANWSALVNGDSGRGIARTTEAGGTSGLKLWTFGPQSLTADVSDSTEWLRPTIEMWHGITPEFWQRTSLASGAVKAWRDHYFPTFGLDEITAASEFGVVHLAQSESGAETVLQATATLTLPGRTVRAVFSLDGAAIGEEEVVVPADASLEVDAAAPTSSITPGTVGSVEFFLAGESLLAATLTFE